MHIEQEVKEKRNGPDRRKRKIPPLKYLLFGGRKKKIRRKEDEQKLIIIDMHGSVIIVFAVLILTLTIIDAFNTLNLIDLGASEINPVMSYLINLDPYVFFFGKCFLAITAIILLIIFRNYKSKIFGIKLSMLFPASALVFLIVIFYQLFLILS